MRTTHYGSAFGERWTYYINGAKVEAPLDWADVVFEFARNKESDGVVMMPSVPVKFGGEGARIIREYVYNGGSGGLTLKIHHVTLQSRVDTYFTGSLSVESFVDNVDSVEIQAEDASLENLVNSKAKVTYEMPFTAARRVEWPGGRVTLDYEAASEEGQTRYKVPTETQEAAVHNMALPVEVIKKGDPFQYDTAAPDVLKAVQATTLSLTVVTNFKGTAAVKVNIKDNDGKTLFPRDNDDDAYGWVAVPISTHWEAGKKYVYTLDFATGAGVVAPPTGGENKFDPGLPGDKDDKDHPKNDGDDDNDDGDDDEKKPGGGGKGEGPDPDPEVPKTGDTILDTPIMFKVTVTEWTEIAENPSTIL